MSTFYNKSYMNLVSSQLSYICSYTDRQLGFLGSLLFLGSLGDPTEEGYERL